MKNFNYGIIAINPTSGSIIHAVGFENVPSTIDWVHLHKELNEDAEHGCVGENFILVPAPEDVLKNMNEILHDPETTIVNNVEEN